MSFFKIKQSDWEWTRWRKGFLKERPETKVDRDRVGKEIRGRKVAKSRWRHSFKCGKQRLLFFNKISFSFSNLTLNSGIPSHFSSAHLERGRPRGFFPFGFPSVNIRKNRFWFLSIAMTINTPRERKSSSQFFLECLLFIYCGRH